MILLGMVAGAAWLLVVPLHWLLTAQQDWRASARADLARGRAEAALAPYVRELTEKLPKEPIWGRFYRPAGAADAGLLLQQDLVQICAASAVTVESVVRLPSHLEGTLLKNGVRVTLSASADHLRIFVDHLRSAPRYLRVEHLHISAPQSQRADENAVVRVTLEIAGYAPSSGQNAEERGR
jgi:hypothetical protein